jgi:hypothetical protein
VGILMSNMIFEIIAASYPRKKFVNPWKGVEENRKHSHAHINLLINAMLCQSSDNWKLTLVSDGDDKPTEKLVSLYSEDGNIQYLHTEHTFGDYGHSPREFGLGHSTGDWIILTSDDNYYAPTFIEEFTKAAESSEDVGFIYCDMNHDHHDYVPEQTRLEEQHIDMGCVAVRSDIAKEVGFLSKRMQADWDFISEIMQKHGNEFETKKIDKVLFVHN